MTPGVLDHWADRIAGIHRTTTEASTTFTRTGDAAHCVHCRGIQYGTLNIRCTCETAGQVDGKTKGGVAFGELVLSLL